MPWNLPTLLTWTRVVAIPLLVAVFFLPVAPFTQNLLATVLFVGAAITDWLDGWLARRWGQTSAFGAFLDPVADKLIVCVALIMLVDLGRVDPVVAAIIIGRELTISALREWMAAIGERTKVGVAWLGKVKTVVQMIAIIILLMQHRYVGKPLYWFGKALLIAAAALTIWSAFVYLRAAWPVIRSRA